MAKIDLKDHISSPIESDEYLDQVNLEDLTDFFYETHALSSYGKKSGKKIARGLSSFFIAKTYLDLLLNEEFGKNTNATIFYLDADQNETIH